MSCERVKFLSLQSKLSVGFFPVIVIYGEDAYLFDKSLDFIVKSLNIEYSQMNSVYLDEEAQMSDILATASALPFCSAKRLVVVKNWNFSTISEGDNSQLKRYLASPNPDCCLVFVNNGQLEAKLNDCSLAVDCAKLDRNTLMRWVAQNAQSQARTIDNRTAQTLCEYCLMYLSRISIELNKLICASDKVIDEELVRDLVHKDAEYVVFDLIDSIADKRNDKVFDMMSQLTADDKEIPRIFSLLYNTYRRMFYISVTDKGDNAYFAKQFGVKEYAVSKSRQLGERYNSRQLLNALTQLRETDILLKQHMFKDSELFRVLVMGLMEI